MADSGPLDETALDETSGAAATTGRGKAELREIERERYELGAEVGRGGLGRVVAARDVYLERAVAIKELVDTDEHARRRFVREALITARLQHPSIVPVYDAGRWPDRAPFYAMKLVAGRPLLGAIGDATTLAARLALVPTVLAVADAVAYAHSERIVHRDLKPQNVLVGSFGETVVIDWGLAKDLAIDDTEALDAGPYRAANSDQTVAGAVLGTPAYMPPEQATGEDVDERADVYALGAMLYHVISGRAPHVGDSVDKMIEQITEGTIDPLTEIEKRVPADLAAIVAKAMARDRSARYADAKELASDLRRFTTGQLVAVYRYTPGERVLRLLRRYRAVVAVAATALVVLAVFGWWSLRAIMRESDEAEIRAEEAIANFNHAMVARARAAVRSDPDEALALLARLDPQGPDWDAARVLAADALSQPRLEHLITATPIGADEWQSLSWHAVGSKLIGFEDHTIAVFDLAHDTVVEIDTPSGRQWFSCANPDVLIGIDFHLESRAVSKLDLSTGAIEELTDRDVWRPYEACTDHVLFEHLFPIDDTLDWWDPATKQRRRLVDHGVVQAWGTRDGKHALVRDTRRIVTWFEPATGKRVELGVVEGGQSVRDPELSDDGTFAIFPGHPTNILQVGKPPRTDTADVVGMSRDGTMLAFANRTETDMPIVLTDGALASNGGVGITGRLGQLGFGEHFLHGFGDRSTMWELATRARFELLETSIQRVDFPLAGDRLARWSADGTLRVWRLPRSTILATPRGKLNAPSRNGRWLVTTDGAETRRLDLHHVVPDEIYPGDGPVPGYVLPESVADDGSVIIGARSGLILWRTGQQPVATGVLVGRFFWAGTHAYAVSETQVIELGPTPRTLVDLPAGKVLVAVSNDLRTLGVVDPKLTGNALHVIDVGSKRDDLVPASMSNAQFSAAGKLVAMPSADQRSVIVWNVDARTSRAYRFAAAHPRLFAFSADERQLAIAGDSIVVVIDVEHDKVRTLATQGDQVNDLVFDPAGARLAVATTREARLYDLASGEVRVVAAAETLAMRFDDHRLVVVLPFATIAAPPDLPSDPFVLSGLLRAQPFQLVKGELRRVGS